MNSAVFCDVTIFLAHITTEEKIGQQMKELRLVDLVFDKAQSLDPEGITSAEFPSTEIFHKFVAFDILSKETLINVLLVLWGCILVDSVTDSFLALSQQSNIRVAMGATQVRDKIASLLTHRSWVVRCATVSTITILCSDEYYGPGVATPEIVRKLVSMLRDNDEDVQKAILKYIEVISQDDDIRSGIIVPAIAEIQQMNDEDQDQDDREANREALLKCLIILSQYGGQHALGDHFATDTPPYLNARLAVTYTTCKAIDSFCEHEDARLRISEPAIIQVIVSFLASEEWEVRERSARLLSNLVKYNEIRAALAVNDIICQLIYLLGDSDSDVQEAAWETVSSLAKHDVQCLGMAMEKQIPLIFDVPTEELRAANTLVTCFIGPREDLPDVLASELDKTEKVQDHDETNPDSIRVTPGTELDLHKARQYLYSRVATVGVRKKLFSMLEHQDWEIRRAALTAIDSTHQILDAEDDVAKILFRLDDEDPDVTQAAIQCVTAFLTSYNKSHIHNITQKAAPKVLLLLEDSDWRVRYDTLQAIFSLVKHGPNDLTAAPDHLNTVFARLDDTHERVRRATLKVIEKISGYNTVKGSLSNAAHPSVVQRIVAMLADDDGRVRRDALQLVLTLSEHENFSALMMTPQNLPKALSVLVDDQSIVRPYIVEGVVKVVVASYEDSDKVISTMKIIITTLGGARHLKKGLVQVIVDIMRYIELDKAHAEIIGMIGEMLGDPSQVQQWQLRRGALEAFFALALTSDAGNARKLIATKEMIDKVLSRLHDPNTHVQEKVLEGILALAKDGK
ncbi:armadillo-type protein [Mycena polygramma]|nr:armadillo-type protein [Mycena polygramma]